MADKIKVVMIDDEEDLCMVVKANLEDTGEFTVVTNTDPNQAVNFIKQEKPDVVLLDNVMPGKNGADLAKELRAKGAETRRIPLVMVSGKGEMVYNKKKEEFKWMPNNPATKGRGQLPDARSAEALSQAYGVDDYVSKPFTTDLLVDVIKEAVKKYKKTDESEEDSGPGPGV
jgi:CheY-like chemotaxis protein